MHISQYSIDINAERCIYEELGRRYKITLELGHYYIGNPVIITVDSEKVIYDDKSGTILYFDLNSFRPNKFRDSIGHDNIPLTGLSFVSRFPHLVEQIKYDWSPYRTTKQLFPE